MSTRKRKQDEELVELPEDGSDEESEEEYISEGDEDVSEVGSEEEEEEDDEVEAEAAPAPPKAKKQKTKPTEVVEEDEPAGEEDEDVEEEDLEDDEAAPDSDGGADEDAAETAKSSGHLLRDHFSSSATFTGAYVLLIPSKALQVSAFTRHHTAQPSRPHRRNLVPPPHNPSPLGSE